jgi:uncharacterized membrane protein YphA (DoxX/SURF4 family)
MSTVKLGRLLKSDVLSLVLRLMVGAMVMVAAVPKLTDIQKNSVELIASYNIFPEQPINLVRILGLVDPYLELLVGAGLICAIFTRSWAVIWAVMSLAFFIIKLDLIFIQEDIVPCGCFGELLPTLLVTQSIWIDIVTMPVCLQIILAERKKRYWSPWQMLPEKWRQSRLRYFW